MMRFSAILFNIVEQCNLRCRHCGFFRSERSGEMAETCLVRWAAQAIEYGIPQVIFTGGEPFTRPGLLRAGVSAVRRAGGKSGVFTNASWAAGVAEAVRVLEPLEGLSELFVSTDLYHLESVPAERVRNAIEAALAAGIRNVVLCVSYTTERDRSAVHGLFADLQDRVRFHYMRVIPAQGEQLPVAGLFERSMDLTPSNYPDQCFLHTPLVNPSGTVSICHAGKVEAHGDIRSSPFYLGDLSAETLRAVFGRAESNRLYQYLRAGGPRIVALAALESPQAVELASQRFTSGCDMCYRLLPLEPVILRLNSRAGEADSEIFCRRAAILGDPL
jgi:hypothetical protein